MKLMLDTNVLVRLCMPGQHRDAKEWFSKLLHRPDPPELLASALVDFEVRRSLRRLGATKSEEHYEELAKSLRFIAVTTEATRRASELSAALRGAHSKAPLSDADMLMAAQAMIEQATLVTADVGLRAVPGLAVKTWEEVPA